MEDEYAARYVYNYPSKLQDKRMTLNNKIAVLATMMSLAGCARQDVFGEVEEDKVSDRISSQSIVSNDSDLMDTGDQINSYILEWNRSNFKSKIFLEGTNCVASHQLVEEKNIFNLSGDMLVNPVEDIDGLNHSASFTGVFVHWMAIDLSESLLFDEIRWDIDVNNTRFYGRIGLPYDGKDESDIQFEYEH